MLKRLSSFSNSSKYQLSSIENEGEDKTCHQSTELCYDLLHTELFYEAFID